MRISVGQYFRHSLWYSDVLHKAFHPPTVPEDLRANQERKHVRLCRSSHLSLVEPCNILGGDCIPDRYVYAA